MVERLFAVHSLRIWTNDRVFALNITYARFGLRCGLIVPTFLRLSFHFLFFADRLRNLLIKTAKFIMSLTNSFLVGLLLFVLAITSVAHEYGDKHVHIDHPWARPTPTSGVPGAVYLTIVSQQDDRLVSASANKDFTRAVEMHDTTMQDGMMRMREMQSGLPLNAGEKVNFEPGGKHIMLMGLSARLKEGDKFPMFLEFEKAGKVAIEVWVEKRESEKKLDHSHH